MAVDKRYDLNCSPLYKINSKRRLCSLLNTTIKDLTSILDKDNYWLSIKASRSGKQRTVHAPKPGIKKIQSQLQKLLSRIVTPEFLFSGKKGTYYKDNAEFHIDSSGYLLNVDISSFYTSCRREYIFKCFHYKFCMGQDIAWLLTDIVSYEEYIPTGSPCSQLVAYFSYEDSFSRIDNMAKSNGLKFSLFVDDMTFSSTTPIPSDFDQMVNKELSKVGLSIKAEKTVKFTPKQHKLITGCIISPSKELRVKNEKRKDIIDSWNELHRKEEKCLREVQSLLGKIVSARQLEPELFESRHQYLSGLIRKLK